jgi:hypothetical protein
MPSRPEYKSIAEASSERNADSWTEHTPASRRCCANGETDAEDSD